MWVLAACLDPVYVESAWWVSVVRWSANISTSTSTAMVTVSQTQASRAHMPQRCRQSMQARGLVAGEDVVWNGDPAYLNHRRDVWAGA